MTRSLALLLLAGPGTLLAEEDEIPIGIEAVTGFRSEYVDRGFQLADEFIDFQLQAEIALSDRWLLETGGWYGTETGSGAFEEVAAFFGMRYEWDAWDAEFLATWHGYRNSFFDDGLDLGPWFNWRPSPDWRIGTGFSYNSGPRGWYGKVDAEWSHTLGDSSFVSFLSGAGVVSDYYGRDGLNDFYARLSWTYGFNKRVAVTPYIGTSLPLGSGPGTDESLFGGIWFEVNF